MNEQQRLIQNTLNRLLADLCTTEVVEKAEEGEFASEVWTALTDTGLTTASVAVEAGGAGGDADDSLLVIRDAAKHAAPVPLAEHYIAASLLAYHGGSIGGDATTVAMGDFRLDDDNRLTGTAEDVAFARWCSEVVLVAKSAAGPKLCQVKLTDAKIESRSNVAGEPRDSVSFDTVMEGENTYETEATVTEKQQLLGAATRCMMMAGALESVLEMSVRYSLERSQFGRPISKFQAIQQQLAVLAGEVAASMMASDAIRMSVREQNSLINDIGIVPDIATDIAIAKARISESVSVCTDVAHQVHGAMGFTLEHPLNHHTRRLWCWREEYGNERHWQRQISQCFLTGGADNLWNRVTLCR